jgi:excisionase family DNA binding protein
LISVLALQRRTLMLEMPNAALNPRTTWLLVREAAEALRVSEWTVRRWIRAGRLRTTRPGHRRLVARVDVEALIVLEAPISQESGSAIR